MVFVELTMIPHRAFDSHKEPILFDVGHQGSVKSVVPFAVLLSEGISDTIRVSISNAPAASQTRSAAAVELTVPQTALIRRSDRVVTC